jgi:plastocyanin domain-containing protein
MTSSILAVSLALSLSASPDKTPKVAEASRVEVSVTADGFVVATPRTLKVGQLVTLVVTRSVERTCATDIVLKDFGISKPLPLGKPVEVTFVPTKKGKVHFSCAMDMVGGDLTVE